MQAHFLETGGVEREIHREAQDWSDRQTIMQSRLSVVLLLKLPVGDLVVRSDSGHNQGTDSYEDRHVPAKPPTEPSTETSLLWHIIPFCSPQDNRRIYRGEYRKQRGRWQHFWKKQGLG